MKQQILWDMPLKMCDYAHGNASHCTCLWPWFLGLYLSVTRMSIDRIYYFLYIDSRTLSEYPRNREKGQTLHTFLISKPRDAFTENSN